MYNKEILHKEEEDKYTTLAGAIMLASVAPVLLSLNEGSLMDFHPLFISAGATVADLEVEGIDSGA